MAMRGGGRFDRRKANLPYNKEGKITTYAKDGGRRALERTKMGDEDDKGNTADSVPRFKGRKYAPTMDQIQQDRLTGLSNQFWSPQTLKKHSSYNSDVVEDIYKTDLDTQESSMRRAMLLEYSQYLENYLWPNFQARNCTKAHIMSIVMMVNEKFRERVPAWIAFQKQPEEFPGFFHRVMELSLKPIGKFGGFINPLPSKINERERLQTNGNSISNAVAQSYEAGEIANGVEEKMQAQEGSETNQYTVDEVSVTLKEQSLLLMFLDHCFTSLEVDLIRNQVQRLVSLAMWEALLDRRRDHELEQTKDWGKYWKKLKKKDKKETDDTAKTVMNNERWFLKRLIDKFFDVVDVIQEKEAILEAVDYCEHFLVLMIGKVLKLLTTNL